jgi:hypothetical protein
MKASQAGTIVGYALENYSGPDAENNGRAMVFISVSYWMPADLAYSNNSPQLSVESFIDAVRNWLAGATVSIQNLTANVLRVGTPTQPVGITIYDSKDGAPYCVKIFEGSLVHVAGECSLNNPNDMNQNPNATDTPSGDPSSSPQDDVTSPVITVLGNNPAEIEVGSTYVDMGITVIDPAFGSNPQNENLGHKVSVNGVEMEQIQIDSSVAGEHTITYSATDQAGNTGTATRQVKVVEANDGQNE